MNFFSKTLGLSIIFFAISCNKPQCNNTNAVFDEYSYQSEVYKTELAKQLNIDNNIRYGFDSYEEVNGIPYLNISIQSDSICAKASIMVENKDSKLNKIIKNKGLGYSGAELRELEIKIISDNGKTDFIYNGLDNIID